MSVQDRGDADDIDRRFAQLVQGWQSDADTSFGSNLASGHPADRQDSHDRRTSSTAEPSSTDQVRPTAGPADADRTPPRLPPAPVEPPAAQRRAGSGAAQRGRGYGAGQRRSGSGTAQPAPDYLDSLDDEPFQPPVAPPIPVRPGVAIGFALLGVALLLAFLMLMGVSIGSTLGPVAGTLGVVGLVVLLLNVRRGPRDDSRDYDPRDGSVL